MLFKVKNLKKRFGGRYVLDIGQLELKARRVYALIGPNGAGKTTLLNHLAFLDRPTSGSIEFRGQAVSFERSALARLRRKVVLVDQSPILFSGTVWKNVEFGLKVRRVAKKERDLKILSALDRVGMKDFARAEVHGLSGGEVKRVALARALVLEPEVLLCDEPTANVDREHQEIILKILAHANSDRHTSVIFSTHYLSQSRRLAHKTILLQNGRLSEHLGENVFSGRLVRETEDGGVFKIADSFNVTVHHQGGAADLRAMSQVHISPDKIVLSPAIPKRQDNEEVPAVGEVVAVRAENGTVYVVVEVGVRLQVNFSKERFLEQPLQVCDTVRVTIPPEAVSSIS